MPFCSITKVKTDLKYKGYFFTREIMFHAERISQARNINKKKALCVIANRMDHYMTGKTFDNPKELTAIIKGFYSELENDPHSGEIYRA